MVAIIKITGSLTRALDYNERKVNKGVAQCIGSGNYPVDLDRTGYELKIQRFIRRAQLNPNAKRNCMHITLNFAPSENHPPQRLIAISQIYLERIGFGKQPYLIYQHHDAGHPHIHIITTVIDREGKRIDMSNLVIKKAEPARKEIEKLFGLIRAEKSKEAVESLSHPLKRIEYGKVETKKAIHQVLNFILHQYRYTCLEELNALLEQYNIHVQRCTGRQSAMKCPGLVYSIITPQGKTMGIPIKASAFYNKPTMHFLDQRFKINMMVSREDRIRLSQVVNISLFKSISLHHFLKSLAAKGITTILKRDSRENICKLCYIDHKSRAVLSIDSIGQQYHSRDLKEDLGLNLPSDVRKGQLQKISPT